MEELFNIGSCGEVGDPADIGDVRAWLSGRGMVPVSNIRDLIEQAHMAGQADAGVDPGYSNAQAYYYSIGDIQWEK
jgi:hypothetical protein